MRELFATVAFLILVHCNESVEQDITTRIIADIHAHKVLMYSKTYCPYSLKLKKLLSLYPIKDFKIVELDRLKDMKTMQAVLKHITGRSTVPQLFIGGEFVGGHDETRAIEDRGDLRRLLADVNAL